MLANLLWIKFDDNTPECGKYTCDKLDWLAESLNDYDDYPAIKDTLKQLQTLPLGIITRIAGVRIVKVLKETKCVT